MVFLTIYSGTPFKPKVKKSKCLKQRNLWGGCINFDSVSIIKSKIHGIQHKITFQNRAFFYIIADWSRDFIDPFRVLISPRVLHALHSYLAPNCTFLRPINIIKRAPVWYKLLELLRFNHFPALISIGCNVKLKTCSNQDALPRSPWPPCMYVDIHDLRMSIYLQHPRCFSLPAVGVKRFISYICGHPYLQVLFYWPLPYFADLLIWIRTTNTPNISQIGR